MFKFDCPMLYLIILAQYCKGVISLFLKQLAGDGKNTKFE